MPIAEGRVATPDLEFATLSAGPADGPLALCLHGFPDSPHSWRHLLEDLADAGYRAVAPYMRGYAPTDVPADGRYQTGALARDACALHEALGGDERACLIGHDWGAIATYGAASLEPQRWRRVVSAAVPPMAVMAGGFLNYDQLQRSWYMFFFQHPLSEMVVAADDLAFIDRLWQDWSPGFDHRAETGHVKDALRDPANLLAALGYYRAQWQPELADPALSDAQDATSATPTQPTLYLHGADDGCIGVGLTDGLDAMLPEGSRVEVLEGCGHFLTVERPDAVDALVIDFLAT